MSAADLEDLAVAAGSQLLRCGLRLATAESCTGGMVAQAITSVAGSSAWFDRGFVTYSNASKQELLGVRTATLDQRGAVDEETAREMALGALKASHSGIALAITGVAGPRGGTPQKPVGTVCIAWADRDGMVRSEMRHFEGGRAQVRIQSACRALDVLVSVLAARRSS
jgi:nicotinamide-nucleotide amidase